MNVVPCSSEIEWLLRRATKKKMIQYLPGDSRFKINQGASINERQRQALEKAGAFLYKYGSTGVQEIINLTLFNLLRLIVVYPVEDERSSLTKKEMCFLMPICYLLTQLQGTLQTRFMQN